MIWFIIAALLTILATWVQAGSIEDSFYPEYAMPPVAVFFVWGVITGLIALFFNGVIADGGKEVWKPAGTVELQNIQQAQDIHGRTYFLGSGSFDSEPAFYYYEKDGASLRLKHVDADSAEIIEVSDTTPHLDIQQEYLRHRNRWTSVFTGDNAQPNYYYTFYVPKGSVSNSFNLGPTK